MHTLVLVFIGLASLAQAAERPVTLFQANGVPGTLAPPTKLLAPAQLTLPEITASTDKALPIDISEQKVPCDQIITRLEDYNKMARQHDSSVSTFLGEVTGKMLSWYDVLQPLEGTSDALPAGVFAPLQDGANKISTVTDLAYENSSLLAAEMDKLIQSLKDCSLTSPRRTP